jgi:flagellin-like hook-associated protein FlgL
MSPSETPEPETLDENTTVEGDTGGDVPVDEGGEGGVEPEGEETDADAEARGAERNPDGTFKKREPVKEAAKEPDATITTATKEPPKAKDHLNDPIPENLKKDTSERIRSLIDTAKSVTAERDKYKTDFDYLVHGVEATGTTPAQYGETLSWLSLFNNGLKGDNAQLEKAYDLIETVAERCALLLGKDRNISDPLKAHADLNEAVRTGKLTPEYAKEIARTRNGQQFRTELNTTATTAQQETDRAAQELTQARADLTALENTLRASDPQYQAKKDILVPALQAVFATIPPSQWKARWTEAYRNIKVGAPAARPTVPANQPLRAGKQPAGGQTKAPGSMLDAINGALASMK